MQRSEQNGLAAATDGLPQIGQGFAALSFAGLFAMTAVYMKVRSYTPVAAALSQPKRIGKPSPPSSVQDSYSGRPTTLL